MSKEAREYGNREDIIIVFPHTDEEPRQIKPGTKMQDPYTFAQAFHEDQLTKELEAVTDELGEKQYTLNPCGQAFADGWNAAIEHLKK